MKRILLMPVLGALLSAASTVSGQTSGGAGKQGDLKVGVLCIFAQRSGWFPFSAGDNRCFKEIMFNTAEGAKGRTLVPRYTEVCLLQTTDGPRLRFVYSAIPKPDCGGQGGYGSPATREQYEPGLKSLGAQEKEFFLKHFERKG